MTPMNIRYSKVLSLSALVVGALLAVISILTAEFLSGGVGVLLLALGILMTVNPMLRIEPHEVQVRNPLGMTLKRFRVTSPADLRIERNALRYVPDGKKISGLGFGVDNSDVARLRAQLSDPPAG